MKIRIKSWEEIEETFDSIHSTGTCYFPSEFAKSVCGKVFDAVPSFLEFYSLKIEALNPENEVERFHLHESWYDVVVEDAPKKAKKREKKIHYVPEGWTRSDCGRRKLVIEGTKDPAEVTCKACKKLYELHYSFDMEPTEDHPRYDIVEEPEVSRDDIYGPLEDLKEGDLLPGDFFTIMWNRRNAEDTSFVEDLFEVLEVNPPFVAATRLKGFHSGKRYLIVYSGDYLLFKLTKAFGQKLLDQGK